MNLIAFIRNRFTSAGLALILVFCVCLIIAILFSRPGITGHRRIFFFFSMDGLTEPKLKQNGEGPLQDFSARAENPEGFLVPEIPASGSVYYEIRYLPSNPEQGEIRAYIDDLLLGPLTMRSLSVFPRGTEIKSCFVRNGNELYVDLSSGALSFSGKVQLTRESLRLFKKNVRTNFPGIRNIYVYVEGTELCEA